MEFIKLTLMFLLFPLYSVSFDTKHVPSQLRIEEMRRDGRLYSIVEIDDSSIQYRNIVNAIAEEHTLWRYDVVSYAPSIVISGKNFTMGCLGDLIVINYREGNEFVQVSKRVKFDCETLARSSNKK